MSEFLKLSNGLLENKQEIFNFAFFIVRKF